MALSFQRVAAFEFLIRFRNVGRGSATRSVRNLRRLRRESKRTTRAFQNSTIAQALSSREMEKAGRSAGQISSQNQRIWRSVQQVNASYRAQRIAMIRARAESRRLEIQQASSSRLARIGASIGGRFGQSFRGGVIGARTSLRANQAARSFAKVGRALGAIGAVGGIVLAFFGNLLNIYLKLIQAGAVLAAGIGLVGVSLAVIADRYTNLTNRIRAATGGQADINTEMNKIADIANRARAPLDTVAEVYGRVALNAEAYGISLQDVARFTESAAKAAKIGGATSREQSQAFIQLAQGIGSNRLSGDELRSVREQTPELAQAIARGLGKPFGELKKLGEQGKLTAKEVVDAVIRDTRNIELRFKRLEATFTDAAVVTKSSLGLFTGSVLSALKLGPRTFRFFDDIAERFQKLSNKSPEIALAISRLPRFFEILNFNGTNRFIEFMSKIANFFKNLPENILKTARSVNQFINAIDSGKSIEEAAQSSFNISAEELQNNPIARFFGDQLPGLARDLFNLIKDISENIGTIANAVGVIARAIPTSKGGFVDALLSFSPIDNISGGRFSRGVGNLVDGKSFSSVD